LQAARSAFGDWQLELGRIFYVAARGEEEAEAALYRRSQFAFAREVFRDTSVEPMLTKYEDAEVDQDFQDEAVRLELFAPSFIPRSHTWWSWPASE
jgi:hypothetical protein